MLIRFYQGQYAEENDVIKSLYEGCPEEKVLTHLEDYDPSDVAVVMGVYKKAVPASFKRGKVISEQHKRGLRALILETGYINRGRGMGNHYALGWDGLNGRADFRNKDSPADRAEKLTKLHPWRRGSKVVLCGQVPWDASVDFTNHSKWLLEAVKNIRNETGRVIVFRPHPLAALPPIPGCEYSQGPLEKDLENAHCLVTFNSNSGVESIIGGVPVFSFDEGSMTYSVSRHDWKIGAPLRPERSQWLNDICYAQWTPGEMRSGEAWKHILRIS